MDDSASPLLPTDLAQALGRRETCVLEFKRSARDRTKIGMAICALANDLGGHGGGDLLIGVDDDGRPVDGVDTSDQELLALTAFRDDGRILDRPSIRGGGTLRWGGDRPDPCRGLSHPSGPVQRSRLRSSRAHHSAGRSGG